ncbi:MAG: hypothetical protein RhofKO_24170 [Rhodothermales bacterium]
MKDLWPILKQTFKEFSDDEAPKMAAALSYYIVFALPPLLVIIITIAGFVLDPADVQGRIEAEMESLIGPESAEQVQTMIEQAQLDTGSGALSIIVGVIALLFGATGAFIQMQDALNRAWDVEPDPDSGGLKNFIFKRLLSLSMIMGIAFLLMVSLALSAALTAFGDYIASLLPTGFSEVLLQALNLSLSLVIISFLFGAMFKVLPDADLKWRNVAVGALVTGVLFTIGKFAIGLYLGQSSIGSTYGAAGSLALLLVWIYYSSMIILIGAEFTQVWSQRKHGGVKASKNARTANRKSATRYQYVVTPTSQEA